MRDQALLAGSSGPMDTTGVLMISWTRIAASFPGDWRKPRNRASIQRGNYCGQSWLPVMGLRSPGAGSSHQMQRPPFDSVRLAREEKIDPGGYRASRRVRSVPFDPMFSCRDHDRLLPDSVAARIDDLENGRSREIPLQPDRGA